MRNKLFLLIIIATLNSCYLFRENGIEVKIKNNSDNLISDIKFSTTENLSSIEINQLNPGESISDFLNMKNNQSDGSYNLTFKKFNGELIQSGAGYYTNGGSLDSRIIFVIENDSVFAKTSQY